MEDFSTRKVDSLLCENLTNEIGQMDYQSGMDRNYNTQAAPRTVLGTFRHHWLCNRRFHVAICHLSVLVLLLISHLRANLCRETLLSTHFLTARGGVPKKLSSVPRCLWK